MIDQTDIDKELSLIFDGDYTSNREWEYSLSSTEIVKRFITIFNKWDKLDEETREKLLKIAVETILNEFPLDTETIKFSIKYIHLDPIRKALLEKLNSPYLAIYYVRELAPIKTLYPDLLEYVKSALEKGVYANYSIEIAALLGIELKPGQR